MKGSDPVRRVASPRELLARVAAESSSLVDMMRRLDVPLGSGPRRYLRNRLEHYGIDTAHFAEEPLPRPERRSYSREVLEEAAARCHTIREVLEYLGVAPYGSSYTHIRKRLDHFGIDTSHFTSRRRCAGFLPPEELAEAVRSSQSLADVLRLLGMPDNGGTRTLVKRSITAHAISTAHFVGQRHGRGRRSPTRREAAEVLRRREPGSPRTKTGLLRRALDDSGVPHRCTECGIGDYWQGHKLVLEIDHINGDRLDDRIENLRYLCPSCHSQTKTFARREH